MIDRERELRRCIVDNIGDCFFHCWENYSEPIPAGVTIGSHPAGVLSFVRGVVEDENGQIYCVNANKIRFLTDKEICDLRIKAYNQEF